MTKRFGKKVQKKHANKSINLSEPMLMPRFPSLLGRTSDAVAALAGIILLGGVKSWIGNKTFERLRERSPKGLFLLKRPLKRALPRTIARKMIISVFSVLPG